MAEPAPRSPFRNLLLIVALGFGGWYFFRHFEIGGLDQLEVRSREAALPAETLPTGDPLQRFLAHAGAAGAGDFSAAATTPLARTGQPPSSTGVPRTGIPDPIGFPSTGPPSTGPATRSGPLEAAASTRGLSAPRGAAPPAGKIRIAAWALAGLDAHKAAQGELLERVAQIVRGFDVIALQQIAAAGPELLPQLVAEVNRGGRQYDFLLGAPTGRGGHQERLAFVFDTERIETDRSQLYTLADPSDALAFDPLVGWFRVRGLPPDQAWTFSLVNLRADLATAAQELATLPQLLAAVRRDGRREDDVILAGLFQADDAALRKVMGSEPITAVVRGTPTDIFSRHQLSNLIFAERATTEYLGRGGVVDFLRLYNLSLEQAEAITPHLPVWAEFSATEG